MGNILEYALRLNDSGFTGPMGRARDEQGRFVAEGQRLGRVAGSVNSVGSAFTSLAAKIGAAFTAYKAVEAAFSGFSKAVNLASSLETTATSFKVLLGSAGAAESMLGRIKTLAAETPFEFPELANAGKSLLAFGESAANIPSALRRIGDIASGVAAPIGEIAEIYGKARTQGTLFSEDINQLTGRGIPIIRELAKVLKQPEESIKRLAEEGRITFPLLEQSFRNLTGGGGQFFGMMAEQSKTFSGLWSTLTDGVNELFLELGKPLNDSLKPLLFDAIGLAGQLKPLFSRIGQDVGQMVKSMRDFVSEAESGGGVAGALVKSLRDAFITAGDALMIPFNAIGAAMPSLGMALLASLTPAVTWLGKSLEGLVLKAGSTLAGELSAALANVPGMGNASIALGGSALRSEVRSNIALGEADDAFRRAGDYYTLAGQEITKSVSAFKAELMRGVNAFSFRLKSGEVMGQMPEFSNKGMMLPGDSGGQADGLEKALSAATAATKESTDALKRNVGGYTGAAAVSENRGRIRSLRDGSTVAASSDRNTTFGPVSQFARLNQRVLSGPDKGQFANAAFGGSGVGPQGKGRLMGGGLDALRTMNPGDKMGTFKRPLATAPNLTPPAAAKATAERQKDVTARVQGQSSGGGGGGLLEEIKRLVSQIEAHTAKLEVVR
jgi:hypothetical protein